MNKIKYVVGPVFVGLCLVAALQWKFISKVAAVTFSTFSDGQVLTAAQLNTAYSTIYNAFNGHNHDGGDGEPSTLAFTGASASFTASGDITFNGATSSLEADGTTMVDVLIDQGNLDTLFGDGTKTTEQKILVRSNTGDAAIDLRVNNSASNTWKMYVDNSDSDKLEYSYNGSNAVEVTTSGGIAAGGLAAGTHGIAWETYSGTLCNSDPCTTDVDTSAPGSGQPLAFSCMASGETIPSRMFYSGGATACGLGDTTCVEYNSGSDDLEVTLSGSGVTVYGGDAYTCIVFYIP